MRNIKSKKGSVLAYILVVMSIVILLLTSVIQFIVSRVKYSNYTHAREEAFQIAESGIQYFRWYLAHNTDGKTGQQVNEFWNTRELTLAETDGIEYGYPGNAVTGKFKLEVIPPEAGSTITTVKSKGWTYKYPNHARTIQVRFRRPSWSEFALLVNDDLRVGEGTEIYGKVKSNTGVRFDGLAHNVVSSASYKYDDPDHGGDKEYGVHTHLSPIDPLPDEVLPEREDVFEAGRVINTVATDFAGVRADMNLMESVAKNGIDGSIFLDNSNKGWHIILSDDGTFSYRNVLDYDICSDSIKSYSGSWKSALIPDGGIIFAEGNIWVEGKIKEKRLSIVAANLHSGGNNFSIFLGNDILYTNYDGRDILGLIADGNVLVVRESKNNLRVDAALLAQEGKVGAGYYKDNSACSKEYHGDIKNSITTYGAIASNIRYGFSWVYSKTGDFASGYINRNIIFDNNLIYYPPPYFPTGSEYLIDLWEEL